MNILLDTWVGTTDRLAAPVNVKHVRRHVKHVITTQTRNLTADENQGSTQTYDALYKELVGELNFRVMRWLI
eukprot:1177663-Prorocentrum_minimum.AAC.4